VLSDWLVVVGGAALILGVSERNYTVDAVILSLGIMSVLWFFFSDAFDAYKMPVLQSTFKSAYTAAKVLALTLVTYTLVAWFVGGFLPVVRPRISETFEAVLLLVPLLAERTLISTLLTRAPLRRRVVVVGANRDGFEMGEALARYDGKSYDFLGYFDDDTRGAGFNDGQSTAWVQDDFAFDGPTKSTPQFTMRGSLAQIVRPTSELLAINRSVGIDQIVLANPTQTVHLLETLSLLHERGVQITPMFALYQDLTGRVPVSHLGVDWYVALPAHVKKTNRTYMMVKRVMDLAMALVMLIVTAPIIPVVALAVRLDSPGPVFFKQVRVGRGGRLFRIVKFRTMRQGAEANTGAVWASDRDPRITRVGRFLRKSRLDEIPQLWNVLVGEMSFVGPRPERPEFDEELEREIPFYRARRAVRPGLTGWAQVSHGYGNSLLDALRKVEYDLYYIKNESMYLDLLILLRTVAVVLKLGGT
jgi:lipopolysaccharide/colanic/teichoic acid biosynthesis glycosyltransferase